MGVFAEELEGSPTIDMDRGGGSAMREFLIPYDSLFPFLTEVFPTDPYTGYTDAASFPAPLTWLVADSVKVRPFGRMHGLQEVPAKYDFFKVSIGYKYSQVDWKMASGGGLDPSGPGGADGSTGGQGAGQGVKWVTHKIRIGGEFIILPLDAIEWEFPFQGKKEVTDITAGKLVPLIEHTLQWSYVDRPPWDNIRDCVGRVNTVKFAGAPEECMLFLGAEATREYALDATSYWNLQYSFSEKNNGTKFVPYGWNHFLRPKTGEWERLVRKTNGEGIYDKVDMKKLFTL